MKVTSQSITAAASVILALAASFYVFKPSTEGNQAAISTELKALNDAVDRLTVTLQRHTTTTAQLDYLRHEIARLEALDKSIRTRIAVIKAEEIKSPTADGEKRIKQLGQAQTKVLNKLNKNREGLVKIIGGLERQLQTAKGVKLPVKASPEKVPPVDLDEPIDPPTDVEEQPSGADE